MAFVPHIVVVSVTAIVPLAAQLPQSRGTVEVLVRSAIDSAAIPFAGVALDSGTTLMTDSTGRLVFHAVPVGVHEILIRRPGFLPGTLQTNVAADARAAVTAWLRPVAQQLGHVVVAAPRTVVPFPQRFTAVAERARRSNGALFTADQIDSLQPLRTKDLLAMLPGVYVNDRGLTFVRCQTGSTLPGPLGDKPSPASIQVYVDGNRLTGVSGSPPIDVLASVNPRSIAAMEVYTGVARIPAEYVNDACAVIAIWTK